MQSFILNLATKEKFAAILGYCSEETAFLMNAFKSTLWTTNASLNWTKYLMIISCLQPRILLNRLFSMKEDFYLPWSQRRYLWMSADNRFRKAHKLFQQISFISFVYFELFVVYLFPCWQSFYGAIYNFEDLLYGLKRVSVDHQWYRSNDI